MSRLSPVVTCHCWRSPQFLSHVKLLLSRGIYFLLGFLLLVVGGIASHFHPPTSAINGNYSECSEDTNASVNNTSDLYY